MNKKPMLRPSQHDQAILCIGSTQAQAPYGWTTNEAAERGKRLHDAVALILQTGEKGITKVKSNALILDDDYAQVEECLKQATELKPADPDCITLVEYKMDLKWLGLTGGKADLVYISPKFEAAVVIDWKFGSGSVPDPSENRQMMDYSVGIKKEAKEKHGVEVESIEAYIIQPASWKADDRLRDNTFSGEELDSLIPVLEAEAQAVQQKDPPRTAGQEQCKWCKHKEKCPEHVAWKAIQDEAKATAKASEIASVVVGSGITVTADDPLNAPVNLISQETVDKAQERLELAKSMKVTDGDTANAAGTLSKDIRKLTSLIEERRKDIKAPFWKFGQKIDAEARKATDPLNEAAKVLDGQVGAYMAAQKAREDARRAEEERKQREAEEAAQKAREAEEARQREAMEAAQKAKEAAERASQLKTKAAREKAEAKAAAELAKAQEAQRLAREEEEKRLQAERDADLAQASALSVEPSKVAGYRSKEAVTWDIDDYGKIPKKLLHVVLQPNMKAVDLLIKQGKISEEKDGKWISIKRETVAARSR